MKYWFKTLGCQILLKNTKSFFWESETNLRTLQNFSAYIGVSYKFVLKSVKTQTRIFWAMQYWFKAWECEIWSTNTKLFFWKRETKLQTLQKLSPYIGVSYKFVLKSVNSLNRFFWVIQDWFEALECQVSSTNIKPFFWE